MSSANNNSGNKPISISKGYMSPTLSPAFFPIHVGEDKSLPFLSLEKGSSNISSNKNHNNNSQMVTTSLSKLGDMTRGRGRQRSMSNTSFSGGETPLSMLTKRTASVSPIRFPSATTSTTHATATNGSNAPRMFKPEYFKTNGNASSKTTAATLSSLLASTTASTTSSNNNAHNSNTNSKPETTTNFNSIAHFLSNSLGVSSLKTPAATSTTKKKKKKTVVKIKKTKKDTADAKSATPSMSASASASASAFSILKRDLTPSSYTTSETTSRSTSRILGNNEQLREHEIAVEEEEQEQDEYNCDDDDDDSKEKIFLIEKFLDEGQKHFGLGNMSRENLMHSPRDDQEYNDDIPVDFAEMVEQSGLLADNLDNATELERLKSNATKIRNTKSIQKHMKRYSHISNFSLATTAVPPSLPSQWEAPEHSSASVTNSRQLQHHNQKYQQQTSMSQYELAEKQLKELQQQQIDLRMKQMELQIEELRLTNEKLRCAIDGQQQNNNNIPASSNLQSEKYETSTRVQELEGEIKKYQSVISKLTVPTEKKTKELEGGAQQQQITNSDFILQDRLHLRKASNGSKRSENDEESSTSNDSQLHIKKLRFSKIDSKQLEQLTRSRHNSRHDTYTDDIYDAKPNQRSKEEVNMETMRLLEDLPHTNESIVEKETQRHESSNSSLGEDIGSSIMEKKTTSENSVTHNDQVLQDISSKTLNASSSVQMSQWKQSMVHQSKDASSVSNNNSFDDLENNDIKETSTVVPKPSHKKARSGYNLNLSIEI